MTMGSLHILYLLGLVLAVAAANDPPNVPASFGCAIPFPLTDRSLDTLTSFHPNDTVDPSIIGAADAFDSAHQSRLKIWPRNHGKTVIIPYCYMNETNRDLLSPRVLEAIQLWRSALGGNPSANTGYGVEFLEYWKDLGTANSIPQYCWSQHPNGQWGFNPDLPLDTVAISIREGLGGSGQATQGWHHEGSTPWMNGLWIGDTAANHVVAHELGHVMGMAHEHQRGDRDQHVRYWCDRIPDFHKAMDDARRDYGEAFTPEMLCTSAVLCAKYGFQGSQYTVDLINSRQAQYRVVERSQYDVESIMHYSSDDGSKDRCQHGIIDECILVKYKENDPAEGVEKIPPNMRVTSRDANWVRMMYPWRNERVAEGGDILGSGVQFMVFDGKVEVLR